MCKLVLIRHGQSEWNKDNRFTGWTDVSLTDRGIEEARKAGRILKDNGFTFDHVFSNVLKRSIKTAWTILEEMDLMWIPIEYTWRLNEKHYGTLQGLNKDETAQNESEEQVLLWRRSFDTPPPALELSDPRHPIHDPKYKDVDENDLPASESLKTTIERTLPYYYENIVPLMKDHKLILISASHNSLRGLVKHLKKLSDEAVLDLNIPYAIPYVFEFDDHMTLSRDYFLGDQEQIASALNEIKGQGKVGQGM